MADVTRVRLPSGEERLVPSLELEKHLDERLRKNGPSIRRNLRQCEKNRSKDWFMRIINN